MKLFIKTNVYMIIFLLKFTLKVWEVNDGLSIKKPLYLTIIKSVKPKKTANARLEMNINKCFSKPQAAIFWYAN